MINFLKIRGLLPGGSVQALFIPGQARFSAFFEVEQDQGGRAVGAVAHQAQALGLQAVLSGAGDELGQLFGLVDQEKVAPHGLEAKRLRLIRHRPDGNAALILLHFKKGGKPGLSWDEQCLYTSEGEQTPYFKEVYHIT